MPIVEGPGVGGGGIIPDAFREGEWVTVEWPGDIDDGRRAMVSFLVHVELEDGRERHVPHMALRRDPADGC
jgi:hypothetical protein